jgi:hypothetical protein
MTVAFVRWPLTMGGAIMRDLAFLLQGKKWKKNIYNTKSLRSLVPRHDNKE